MHSTLKLNFSLTMSAWLVDANGVVCGILFNSIDVIMASSCGNRLGLGIVFHASHLPL